ncbi:hypothetical protein Efla_002249 [Eimeria flavescens]
MEGGPAAMQGTKQQQQAAAAAPAAAAEGQSAAAAVDDDVVRHRPAPVIGVLIQPVDDNLPSAFSGFTREGLEASRVSYLAASYVKFIEAAGCVAMPVDLWVSEEEHRRLFSQMNGLLLPGGSADINEWEKPYVKTVKLYYQLAQEANDRGQFFPIFAICLGFEALVVVASNNTDYFTKMENGNLDRRRVLTFKEEAEQSVLFGNGTLHPQHQQQQHQETVTTAAAAAAAAAAEEDEDDEREEGPMDITTLRSVFSVPEVKKLLATHPIAYFHHQRHIKVDEFEKDNSLLNNWRLLASALLPGEKQQVEIVAAIEHKKYPFFGMQFHPEKALFEHCPKTRIPHFFLSTLPSIYIASLMGLAARRSRNFFKCEVEKFHRVSFAFTPVRTALLGREYHFEQTYLFAKLEGQSHQPQVSRLSGLHAQQQTQLPHASTAAAVAAAAQQQQQQVLLQEEQQQQSAAAAAAEEA